MSEPQENGGTYGQTEKVFFFLSSYVEAHKVQQKIAELEQSEKQKWMENRDNKMNTALNQLRAKQEVEVANLKKKIRTGEDELNKQLKKDEEKLHLKFENIKKEQRGQQ